MSHASPTPSPSTAAAGSASGSSSSSASGSSAASPARTGPHPVSHARRDEHLRWLLEISQIPTAAGKEQRVIAWVERWAAARPDVRVEHDRAGNITLSLAADAGSARPPLYFTAHLDHPAFVVEQIVAPQTLMLSFRGGVMEDYFRDARITVHDRLDHRHGARLVGRADPQPAGPFTHYLAELDDDTAAVALGDVATWELPPAEISDELVHTAACDDLAALAAALAAFDVLRTDTTPANRGAPVRVLLTRAEEVGFIGAIAAVRQHTVPQNALVLALENSRSFADSPINGGPIVRVGDRISVFSPTLTDAVAKRAEEIAGGPATPTASQKLSDQPSWKWQRKLMAGGACEASVFCAAGLQATCLCLPLGNYHNMADLANVQAGTNTTPARVAREYIGVGDYHGLIDLLIACGISLPAGAPITERLDKLWNERAWVLS